MIIRQRERNIGLHIIAAFAIILFVSTGCSTYITNIRDSRPFVFDNKIEIDKKIKLPNSLRSQLDINLPNYWDDSIKAMWKTKLYFDKSTFLVPRFKQMQNPVPYDSFYLERTKFFMTNYLNSLGFYNASFEPLYKNGSWIKIDVVKGQKRAIVGMLIKTGKYFTIDSVRYSIATPKLQELTNKDLKGAVIKRNDPYTKQAVGAELDRLVSIYRNNGYLQLSREDFIADLDTTVAELRDPDIDPFEQLDAIKRQRENPKMKINIVQNEKADASHFRQYYVGTTTIYPEMKSTENPETAMKDSSLTVFPLEKDRPLIFAKLKDSIDRVMDTVKYRYGNYTYNTLHENNFLRPGQLFDQRNLTKTQNAFNAIGAWIQTDVRTDSLQHKNDSIVNFHFFLTPALRQSLNYSFEGSSNNSTSFTSASNSLLGLAVSASFRDRNAWRRGIQSNTFVRAGVELNLFTTQKLIQTIEAGFGHSYTFPGLILPNFLKKLFSVQIAKNEISKTYLSAEAKYSVRQDLFRQTTINAYWGYEWKKANHIVSIRFPSVELNYLDTNNTQLTNLIKQNPLIGISFIDGSVANTNYTYIINFNHSKINHSSNLRLSLEESGFILGNLFPSLRGQLIQYAKIEAEYKFLSKKKKSEIAFRAFAGYGYRYGDPRPEKNITLPFFKQFTAGGPNSMRAWNVRQLGQGSSIFADTSSLNLQFGDIQLETNLEYRFKIVNLLGRPLSGAFFTDVGNIWNRRVFDPLTDVNKEFQLSRLYRDLAMAAGFGLRYDFNSVIVRFDLGFKVKDPARQKNDGWIYNFSWTEGNENKSNAERSNWSLQFAIGMPF
jgi:outer membrane protein insertion porin family